MNRNTDEATSISHTWTGQSRMTVLDTEFGQGLLFLKLWNVWKQHSRRPQRLHVVGLVPRLSERADLRGVFKTLLSTMNGEQLRPQLEAMLAVWPLNLPGLHRLEFESGAITLTLAVGPVDEVVRRLRAQVDCFVLKDKFLLPQLSPLATSGAQAWITTEQDGVSGIEVVAVEQSETATHACSDPWSQSPVSQQEQHALVVGGGFAGMGVAQSLALRGWRVTVIDTSWGQSTSSHLHHAAAALTPTVSRDDNLRARLSRAGFLRAQSRWSALPDSVLFRCGAIQLQRDQGRIVDLAALIETLDFPTQWAQFVSADHASALAGMPLNRGGIYFPTAARVQPQRLLDSLAATPGVEVRAGKVGRIFQHAGIWQALDDSGTVLASASHVVLAAGFHTQTLLRASGLLSEGARLQGMHALGGEVTFLPAADIAGGPRCIVSGDGYVLPQVAGQCVIGSTYAHAAKEVSVTDQGVTSNLYRAAGLLNIPELPGRLAGQKLDGWAGWRAVLPGRLPSIGPVRHAPGVWVACGFASRGLTWATLAGDLIAGALNGEPLVLENDIIEAISDN